MVTGKITVPHAFVFIKEQQGWGGGIWNQPHDKIGTQSNFVHIYEYTEI